MIYVIGTSGASITVGMSHCEEKGVNLPFIAFGPTGEISAELSVDAGVKSLMDEDEVKRAVEAFNKHGTVVFLDNPMVAERVFDMIDALMDIAMGTDWSKRVPMKKGAMN